MSAAINAALGNVDHDEAYWRVRLKAYVSNRMPISTTEEEVEAALEKYECRWPMMWARLEAKHGAEPDVVPVMREFWFSRFHELVMMSSSPALSQRRQDELRSAMRPYERKTSSLVILWRALLDAYPCVVSSPTKTGKKQRRTGKGGEQQRSNEGEFSKDRLAYTLNQRRERQQQLARVGIPATMEHHFSPMTIVALRQEGADVRSSRQNVLALVKMRNRGFWRRRLIEYCSYRAPSVTVEEVEETLTLYSGGTFHGLFPLDDRYSVLWDTVVAKYGSERCYARNTEWGFTAAQENSLYWTARLASFVKSVGGGRALETLARDASNEGVRVPAYDFSLPKSSYGEGTNGGSSAGSDEDDADVDRAVKRAVREARGRVSGYVQDLSLSAHWLHDFVIRLEKRGKRVLSGAEGKQAGSSTGTPRGGLHGYFASIQRRVGKPEPSEDAAFFSNKPSPKADAVGLNNDAGGCIPFPSAHHSTNNGAPVASYNPTRPPHPGLREFWRERLQCFFGVVAPQKSYAEIEVLLDSYDGGVDGAAAAVGRPPASSQQAQGATVEGLSNWWDMWQVLMKRYRGLLEEDVTDGADGATTRELTSEQAAMRRHGEIVADLTRRQKSLQPGTVLSPAIQDDLHWGNRVTELCESLPKHMTESRRAALMKSTYQARNIPLCRLWRQLVCKYGSENQLSTARIFYLSDAHMEADIASFTKLVGGGRKGNGKGDRRNGALDSSTGWADGDDEDDDDDDEIIARF